MTVDITIPVHPDLAQRLRPFRERLPELLERGLRDVILTEDTGFDSENEVMEILTSNPTPEQVMALRPSPKLQSQVSALLMRSKQGELSQQEQTELDRYLHLEHLVRLAKAHVAKRSRDAV